MGALRYTHPARGSYWRHRGSYLGHSKETYTRSCRSYTIANTNKLQYLNPTATVKVRCQRGRNRFRYPAASDED